MDLEDLTIKKFHKGLINKEFSATEAAGKFFDYINEKDKDINAFIWLSKDLALSQAKAIDADLAAGKKLDVLAGVPLAIKDNILIENEPATAASKILQNYRATYDATVIKKLKFKNAIFLGKTNMDEFAMGSSTENSVFGPTKNPHDLERTPGGSSGGSAAAVAANMAVGALGSDTAGSIRQPASFCGAVGLKPTYGAVSRFGLIAMASSLDQIGPIAKTVEDAEILFEAIKGRDLLDSTSINDQRPTTNDQRLKDLKNLTIGLPKEYFIEGLDKEVASAIEEAIKTLKNLGIKFKEISLPYTKYALSCYYIVMSAEASANLARFDGIRYSQSQNLKFKTQNLLDIYLKTRGEGFNKEVKRRIILGTFVLSSGYYDAYYTKAQKVRRLIKEDFDKAFDLSVNGVDMILTPVAPTSAFKIGEKIDNPLLMYLSDIFTAPMNLAGLPAISIPVKKYQVSPKKSKLSMGQASIKRQDELPIGFQLIGKYFREADILEIGKRYEQTTSH